MCGGGISGADGGKSVDCCKRDIAIYMLVLSEGVVLGVLTGVLTGGNIKKAMVTTGVLTVAGRNCLRLRRTDFTMEQRTV